MVPRLRTVESYKRDVVQRSMKLDLQQEARLAALDWQRGAMFAWILEVSYIHSSWAGAEGFHITTYK